MGDNTKGRRLKRMTQLERDFEQHLEAAGHSKQTVIAAVRAVHRFLCHLDGTPLAQVSEQQTGAYFAAFTGATLRTYSSIISRFLKFAAARHWEVKAVKI